MRLSLTAAVLAAGPALLLVAGTLPARAEIAPAQPVSGVFSCENGWILGSIRRRFAHAAAKVEKRDLEIVAIAKIQEVRATVNDPSPLPRRWCTAAVTLSDGSRTTMNWLLTGGVGFAGPGLAWIPDEVEFCVAGHDPWRVHDGACRTTRRWW